MKKFLLIILSSAIAFSLIACAGKKATQNQNTNKNPMSVAYDTMIQDAKGTDKCFWEDGLAKWNNHSGSERQKEKSAVLTVQTEYDMWIELANTVVDFNESYYPIEYECDETKIEVKANPDKENHFVLKVLQPCDNEKLKITFSPKTAFDGMLDDDGKEIQPLPAFQYATITISAEE